MKKTVITILLTSLFFYACTKDGNKAKTDTGNNYERLIGKWYWDSVRIKVYINNVLIASGPHLSDPLHNRERFEFRTDGTMLLRDDTSNDPDSIYPFSYDAALQVITINRGHGELHPFYIDTLTATKLIITTSEHYPTSKGVQLNVFHYSCVKGN